MILYCDSSALLKLYVAETDSAALTQAASAADILAVCRVTWAECMSAMARRVRENPGDADAVALSRQRFSLDWPRFLVLEVTQSLVELAGDYADLFALRGYDSIQLAAAKVLERAQPGEVIFACFDARLIKAARILGLETV